MSSQEESNTIIVIYTSLLELLNYQRILYLVIVANIIAVVIPALLAALARIAFFSPSKFPTL